MKLRTNSSKNLKADAGQQIPWVVEKFFSCTQKKPSQKWRLRAAEKYLFYVYSVAQYSLKFPARVVPAPPFLLIYVIMTSFPQTLAKLYSIVDFYFIHSYFSYDWTWISKLWSLNKWYMGNLQMCLWRHTIMTSQCSRNKNVTKIVKNYHFE